MDNDQDGEIRRYVVITQAILGNKDLNATDKLILAYISSYEQFYASNASTAEFLGLSERIVERAKQKLTRLGFIRVIKNTGRGNIYAFNLACLAKNGESDAPKMANQMRQKWRTEIKEEIKEENYKGDESVAEGVEKSAEYGRKDINDLIEAWSDQIYDIRADKNQRRQAYNLIRKYGVEGAQRLVERVATMKRQNDRFAPNIAKLSDLTGKYSKLDKLEAWEQRQEQTREAQTPQYVAPPPYYRQFDGTEYGNAWREIPDEERAETRKIIAEARQRLGFKKGGK